MANYMAEFAIKQEPYVDDHGIYVPIHEYVPEGTESAYQCIMTKEMFVEAYNKWVKQYKPRDWDDCEWMNCD